jgi:hypothetical protein
MAKVGKAGLTEIVPRNGQGPVTGRVVTYMGDGTVNVEGDQRSMIYKNGGWQPKQDNQVVTNSSQRKGK